ncbi:zinc finger protein 711-like [Zophobas morio]|uniref:zinc finger protein 711-like n=1 Tax=Zophobas morio TaxID=2755281 RepID=UPI003082A847
MAAPLGTIPSSTRFLYALVPTRIQFVPKSKQAATSGQVRSNSTQIAKIRQYKRTEMREKKKVVTFNKNVPVEEEIEIKRNFRSRMKYEIHTTTDKMQTHDAIFLGETGREAGNIIMVQYSIQEEHSYSCCNYDPKSETDRETQIAEEKTKTCEPKGHVDLEIQQPGKKTRSQKHTWYTCHTCDFKTKMEDSFRFHVQSGNHKVIVYAAKKKEKSATNTINRRKQVDVVDNEAPPEIKMEIVENDLPRNETHETTKMQDSLQFSSYATETEIKQEPCEDWAEVNVHEDTKECIPLDTTPPDDVPDAKFKCLHCKYQTDWKNNMTKHVAARHTPSDKIQWFHCAHCSYKAKVRENLLKHWQYVHNKSQTLKWLYCDKCSYKAKGAILLKNHVITYHTRPDEIKWWACDECPFRGKLKTQLTWHMKTKHRPVWLCCDKCHYKTMEKNSLLSHIRMHDKILKWFRCKQCPYQSFRIREMEEHIRALHGVEKFDFELAELSFSPKVPTKVERDACFEGGDNGGVKCKFCDFVTDAASEVERHIGERHNLITLV